MVSIVYRLSISFAVCFNLLVIGGLRADTCENPDTLRVAANVPAKARISSEQREAIRLYLEKSIGKNIVMSNVESYSQSLIALRSGRLDWVRLGPNAYVQGREKKADIEAFATYRMKPGHTQLAGLGYRSILIVRSQGSYKTLQSLKGARLALVDPGSSSGYLVPMVLFRDDISTPLEQYFGRILISGKQDLSISAVASGKVDAAFVSTIVFDMLVNSGVIGLDDFKVLWQSSEIPHAPFVYRSALCAELKEKIAEALLQAHRRKEAQPLFERMNAEKVVRVRDKDFDIIRQLLIRNKKYKDKDKAE